MTDDLKPLPPKGWPAGYWLSTGGLCCCALNGACPNNKTRHSKMPPGATIFLTGVPGEVFCARHAAARKMKS